MLEILQNRHISGLITAKHRINLLNLHFHSVVEYRLGLFPSEKQLNNLEPYPG